MWFPNSGDVFRHNIGGAGYKPIGVTDWGKEVDFNLFPDSLSLSEALARGTDSHSVAAPLIFVDPDLGDFRLKDSNAASSIGFKNFAMDSFGVISANLKARALTVSFPEVIALHEQQDNSITFLGAIVKNVSTDGERSATGMGEIRGVLVTSVAEHSAAASFLQPNDVILTFAGRKITNTRSLLDARMSVIGTNTDAVVFRNQKEIRLQVQLK